MLEKMSVTLRRLVETLAATGTIQPDEALDFYLQLDEVDRGFYEFRMGLEKMNPSGTGGGS